MVSEQFKVYHNECLLGLSGHPLSGRYRTTHNIISHERAVMLDIRGALEILHRLYVSGYKPHSMSRFYGVELGLKSTL